jgi:hypothetical protein
VEAPTLRKSNLPGGVVRWGHPCLAMLNARIAAYSLTAKQESQIKPTSSYISSVPLSLPFVLVAGLQH